MNRIEEKFIALKNQNKKALITFLTAFDPDLDGTLNYIKAMAESGADIIEIGIPFSDPIAEGPVIQKANARALLNKFTIDDIMNMVKTARQFTDTPFLYLLYFNTIFNYGIDKFFASCKQCGIDGVIIPDLPFEEAHEIAEATSKYDIINITLISPISKDRINAVTKGARGFLYCVSSLGVTGMRNDLSSDFEKFSNDISSASDIPRAIGFGIHSPEQIRKLGKYFDGFIVGSAIVDKISRGENIDSFIRELKRATD